MYSVVMPLYNEGSHIYNNMHETALALRLLGDFEIIVVNDGSSDNSHIELERALREIPEAKALNLPHSGKGEALRQGALASRGDYVIFLDSDLDLPPEQILFFVAVQRAKKADAVIGSKMHPDSTVDYPFVRRVYSMGYFLLVKILFGLPVRDTQTGLKLVRRDLLVAAIKDTEVKGFSFDLELLVRLVQLKAKLVEAPVVVDYHRKFGGVGPGTVWQIFRETMQTWRRTRRNPSR
jgi:glycosyltransferase involved in cell wall biosynthesis